MSLLVTVVLRICLVGYGDMLVWVLVGGWVIYACWVWFDCLILAC